MSKTFTLRARSKSGRFVINGLSTESTLWKLQKALEEKTSIEPDLQKILNGYPPEQISSYEPTASLSTIGISSGDSLIVEHLPVARERCVSGRTKPTSTNTATATTTITAKHDKDKATPRTGQTTPTTSTDSKVFRNENDSKRARASEQPTSSSRSKTGKIVRKVVPADNSCLFRSISILLSNGRDTPSELRELAAGIILSNPDQYSSVMLGRSNQEYVEWLLKNESWGGAIELAVYSEHFKTELDVVDIQSQRIDRFGEDQGYTSRALLMYDGIHYDAIALEDSRGAVVQRVFPVSDDSVLVQALQLASQAKKARQFTDVVKFSLRCLVCGTTLTGQTDAQRHAHTTGHINFGEV